MAELILLTKKAAPKGKKDEFPSLLEQAKAALEDLKAGRVKEI